MINLQSILNEGKNSLYYDFQIVITPHEYQGISFLHRDGRIEKHTTSVKDDPLVLNYRNVPGMVKAAYKLKNDKSKITIWDSEGKGKTYPLTTQNLRLIKKQ